MCDIDISAVRRLAQLRVHSRECPACIPRHLLSTPLIGENIALTAAKIGTALRVAVTFGLHRERPTQDWGPSITERCQRVWWTVYVLDRTFSSSMGVPISIQDADITTTMPSRDGARDSMTLYVHVKLSNLISEVVNSKPPIHARGLYSFFFYSFAEPGPVYLTATSRGLRCRRSAPKQLPALCPQGSRKDRFNCQRSECMLSTIV